MNNINRNSPCPCGSGLKYKKCCGEQMENPIAGLRSGIRMKGGIRYDEEIERFVAMVHIWDNVQCIGEPDEWRSPKVFTTEDAALAYYKTHIRPRLQQMMTDFEKNSPDGKAFYRKLE